MIRPARTACRFGKHKFCTMSRRKSHQHHHKHHKKHDMQKARKRFESRYQEPCLHVHEATHHKQGKDEQCDVPRLWLVVGIVCCHKTLQHKSGRVGDTGESGYPGEAGDPTLHPGDESTLTSRRESMGPVLCLIVSNTLIDTSLRHTHWAPAIGCAEAISARDAA